MKRTGVAAKIGAGFALVIVITACLGAVELWNMAGVQGDASRLDSETVPQVVLANNIERGVLQAMYSFRGFLLTMDSDALDQARQRLQDTQKYLQDAEAVMVSQDIGVWFYESVAVIAANKNVQGFTPRPDEVIEVFKMSKGS